MNILILGNGFDLEHGLPTKYTDFLEFLKEFSDESYYRIVNHSTSRLHVVSNCYIKKIFEEIEYSERLNALTLFTNKNLWIKHFEKVRKENLKKKENWIDFETEILRIIQAYNDLLNYYKDQKNGNDVSEKVIERCRDIVGEVISKKKLTEKNRKSNIILLLEDLNKLIGALEIYVWDYIGNQKLEYYNPSINDIHVDKVLSFNYSDTFRTLYDNDEAVEYCFIHGKARNNITFFKSEDCQDEELKQQCIKANAEYNNMVLGIEEYLPEDRKSNETDLIAFKKYYQRIYKKTGNEYKLWLQQIDKKKAAGDFTKNTVYIFGHSLDVTDGDVLRELINFDGMKTVIFYRNKDQLGQQIANLVKILKSDNVIEKVYGSNPSIEFRQQKERKNIIGSVLEFASDIKKLKTIYKYNKLEMEQITNKIKSKIEKSDLNYFYSQDMVISLFAVLQRIGLGRVYKDKLLEIAYSLIKNEGLDKPIQYSIEDWVYQDFDFNGFRSVTESFIDSINTYNKNNFAGNKNLVSRFTNKIFDSVTQLVSEYSFNFSKYLEMVEEIFMQFEEENSDIEELWELLIYVSKEYGEDKSIEALEYLIDNSEDDFDIIRYNQLINKLIC